MVYVTPSDSCGICRKNFLDSQRPCIELSCIKPHIFHEHCLNDSLKISDKCPLCRKEIKQYRSLSNRISTLSNTCGPIFLIFCLFSAYIIVGTAILSMSNPENPPSSSDDSKIPSKSIYKETISLKNIDIDFSKSSDLHLSTYVAQLILLGGVALPLCVLINKINCLKDCRKPSTSIARIAMPVRKR